MQTNNGAVNTKWVFTDEIGTFEWQNPCPMNQLYFPVCNEAGMMASVTPKLHGDATTGQHTFVRLPLVMEDLHNTRSARNFWIYNEALGAYSLTGNSAQQLARSFNAEDQVQTTIRGAFLAHTLIREDRAAGIKAEITIFCPVNDDKVEIIQVKITNLSTQTLSFVPTTGLSVYGRSADSVRDHNHWTSMSHRMELNEYGMLIKPAMHHDESGHKPNFTTYFVLAVGGNGEKPVGQFPTVAEFIGEGSFDWPEAVAKNLVPYQTPPNRRDGMEAVGAIRFEKASLAPGETREYILLEGAAEEKETILRCIERYGTSEKVRQALDQNRAYWQNKVEQITFETGDRHFERWMHWVALQPILRKIYGNSFLPHFDYGKGGRGWRDLWQDCLALLLQNPAEMKAVLIANFGGVRLDGSNATIIQKGLGQFAADRNKISRVWMDHGIWPYFTTKLYVDQTGDIDIFFTETTYWKDHQNKRAKARDNEWRPSDGVLQKNVNGEVYRGSLIEHVLVQHLTCFYNVGDHNNMKLEDADWNDLLDLANEKGESVPFSAFYGWNLISIAELLLKYQEVRKIDHIKLYRELLLLAGFTGRIDYESPRIKRELLNQYFESVEHGFLGEKVEVSIDRLSKELKNMGEWVLKHIRRAEWIESKTGYGFFNGYYNNDAGRVDGDHEDGVRMNLTAQTFAIMSGAATEEQVLKAYLAAGAILKDPNTGGYRLTTPLGPNTWNFGRGFAVVYGEKETGGTFNHMAVMFMNGLYRRKFVKEAYEVFTSIYRLANDTENARIYPGIPEYISSEGRGKYHYLSGSASWLLMTVLTEMYGVKGEYGDLILEPKLVSGQFDGNCKAQTKAFFLGRRIIVTYHNPSRLDYDQYQIGEISVNEKPIRFERCDGRTIKIHKCDLEQALDIANINRINVNLGLKLD
jgi:cellobiose phosphorylase